MLADTDYEAVAGPSRRGGATTTSIRDHSRLNYRMPTERQTCMTPLRIPAGLSIVWTEERRQVNRDATLLWYACAYADPAHKRFDNSFRHHAVRDRQVAYFAVA